MTKRRLAAIQRRANAATPAPWSTLTAYIDGSKFIPEVSISEFLTLNPQDAEFIAHAREDIPALLEYIKELQAENADLGCFRDLYFSETNP